MKAMFRAAIAEGHIKALEVARLKGRLQIQMKHKRYKDRVDLVQLSGILLATLSCQNRDHEWQLLEMFVGGLVYHFRDKTGPINVQPVH